MEMENHSVLKYFGNRTQFEGYFSVIFWPVRSDSPVYSEKVLQNCHGGSAEFSIAIFTSDIHHLEGSMIIRLVRPNYP